QPTRCPICSCVSPNSWLNRAKARACSMQFRSARCRFSMTVISAACSSDATRTMAGILSLPARREARQRRYILITGERRCRASRLAGNAHDGGNLVFAGQARGAAAALSGDQDVAAVYARAHHDRLNDAAGLDGIGQLPQFAFAKNPARLIGIVVDEVER